MPANKHYQYATHADIPAGTGVFTETVLQIFPFNHVTLYRKVKAGQFPAPIYYSGRRPVWNIDHVRAVMAGTWRPTTKAQGAA